MTVTYLDTSAALKLVVDEAESDPLAEFLANAPARRLIASWLLHAELHCAAGRRSGLVPAAVAQVLQSVDLIDLTRADLVAAGAQGPLRTNDAIHLAVALRVEADEIATYDGELARAAAEAGISVVSPGTA